MKKEIYTSPQLAIIELAENVRTDLANASAQEGSAVLVSWLVG